MSVSRFKPPSTAASVVAAAPAANTTYQTFGEFEAGIWTISCATTTVATVAFWAGTTLLATASTVSGSVQVSIGQNADSIVYYTDTGSDIQISLERTGVPLLPGVSGTLDTITATGTYTETGYGYALIVAGGRAGGNAYFDGLQYQGGAGGASGGVIGPHSVVLTGSMPVVIGAGGTGGGGAAGGNTTFAGYTATSGGTGSGGQSAISANGKPVVFGTTGGGGRGAGSSYQATAGAGSGIGRGGDGKDQGSGGPGGNATGYGGGGGGAYMNNNTPQIGGNGSQGVVYVLRLT